VTASERATAGSVRSAHVAHFLPPDWGRVARVATPALERVARDLAAPQVLILVPDAGAAVALARALASLDAAEGLRIVAATTASRAKRLLAAGPAQVVIGAPFALAPALAASTLKLDQVSTVMFAAADELDAEDADLASVVVEAPKGASRVLTALEATDGVETLIERYMHKARRVTEDVVAATDVAGGTTNLRFLAVVGSPVDAVPQILDDVDPPTAAILAADETHAAGARVMLRALGHADEALARVTAGDVTPNTALVVLLGVPSGSVWAQVLAAKPAQVVAVIAPRQRAALQRLAGDQVVLPFVARSAVLKARAAEARARAELREILTAGIPSREVLALEPLMGEFEGLEIAAAALRLLDRTRASQDELVRTAEGRIRAQMKEAAAADRDDARGDSRGGDRPPRSCAPRGDKTRGFAPRGGGDKPRGPRAPRGGDDFPLREPGERPRAYAPREGGDKARSYVPRASGDKPRGFAPRGGSDKPRGFAPRGGDDKPRGFAPRGDKPRGPRRDDDRGPRGPRGPR
jgi:ATP-dependent RNA helicase DeaD